MFLEVCGRQIREIKKSQIENERISFSKLIWCSLLVFVVRVTNIESITQDITINQETYNITSNWNKIGNENFLLLLYYETIYYYSVYKSIYLHIYEYVLKIFKKNNNNNNYTNIRIFVLSFLVFEQFSNIWSLYALPRIKIFVRS